MSSISSSTITTPSTSPLLQGQRNTSYFAVDSSSLPSPPQPTQPPARSAKQPRPLERLLMPENTASQDSTYHENQRRARRRIRNFVFEDVHLDWKSAPTLCEDHPFEHRVLEMHRDLRCNASRSYLYQIRDVLRRLRTPTSMSISESGTLFIDGEEVIDMIG